MMRRLVLGCGEASTGFVRRLALTDDVAVVTRDVDIVRFFRDVGIEADVGNPTDSTSVTAHTATSDTVIIAGSDPSENLEILETVRTTGFSGVVVVFTGWDPPTDVVSRMSAQASRVIFPADVVGDRVIETIHGEISNRARSLLSVVRSISGPIGVFMHDNPDPDAIGSAIAVRELVRATGNPAEACYFGDISHQENRALVNLLDLSLTQYDPGDEPEYSGIILVDHSRPGINDHLPEDMLVAAVIDHHPPRGPVHADYIDIRTDGGATSTLVSGYYRELGMDVPRDVATALLFGIRVDTDDFSREVTAIDFEAAGYLLPYADTEVLERVEHPTLTGDTLDTISRAIRNRVRRDSVLVSSVGQIRNRDTLAQAADQLLTIDGISTTLVFGFDDGTIYISARSRGTDIDIGEALREAFDAIGSAGGHADMAGAQLPLGILGDTDGDDIESLETVVADMVTNRFFEVIGIMPISVDDELAITDELGVFESR